MLASATVVLAVAGYATADVLDVAPGILTLDRPVAVPAPTVSGTPAPVLLPAPATADTVLTDTGVDAPLPTEEGLAAAVAKARSAENERCFAAFGKGTLDALGAASLRSCLARDARGKVAKQVAKLEKALANACSEPGDVPDFGVGSGGAAPLAYVGATQTTRVLLYNRSLKNDSVVDVAKKEAGKDASAIEKIVEDPKAALKSVTNPK